MPSPIPPLHERSGPSPCPPVGVVPPRRRMTSEDIARIEEERRRRRIETVPLVSGAAMARRHPGTK